MADSVATSAKYCRDCVYADVRNLRREEDYTCEHPTNLTGEISLITGRSYVKLSAMNSRVIYPNKDITGIDSCGPEGIYHKTHTQRVAEAQARAGILPVKNTEPANPSLTLLTRLSKMKFDVDKL